MWGDVMEDAAEAALYDELKRFLAGQLSAEQRIAGSVASTVDLTHIVHECWIRLQGRGPWQNRAHFFGAASRLARQILVDEARRRARHQRHAANIERRQVRQPSEDGAASSLDPEYVLRLDAALADLAEAYPRAAETLSYRVFGDLDTTLISDVLGVSARTVQRDLRFASAWLRVRLERPAPPP